MDADKQPSQDEQPPVLDYAGLRARSESFLPTFIGGLLMLGLIIAAALVFLPAFNGTGSRENTLTCASNLRRIGEACFLYAHDHQGRFPASFAELIRDGRVSNELFVCLDSNEDRAIGNTPHEILAQFSESRHCSYVYVGSGLSASSPADTVVAYERLANHENQGINVLYADGHVAWMPRPSAAHFIAELNAGFNPPRPLNQRPATQPATP